MWQQQKMKVNLAAQTLSSISVADSIQYCNETLQMDEFRGSEATVKFIRIFDHLFDVLNSRNPLAKGYKSNLRLTNQTTWLPFLDDAQEFILGLKDTQGRNMHMSRRNTGFFGLLIAIQSVKSLFMDLVACESPPH